MITAKEARERAKIAKTNLLRSQLSHEEVNILQDILNKVGIHADLGKLDLSMPRSLITTPIQNMLAHQGYFVGYAWDEVLISWEDLAPKS